MTHLCFVLFIRTICVYLSAVKLVKQTDAALYVHLDLSLASTVILIDVRLMIIMSVIASSQELLYSILHSPNTHTHTQPDFCSDARHRGQHCCHFCQPVTPLGLPPFPSSPLLPSSPSHPLLWFLVKEIRSSDEIQTDGVRRS